MNRNDLSPPNKESHHEQDCGGRAATVSTAG